MMLAHVDSDARGEWTNDHVDVEPREIDLDELAKAAAVEFAKTKLDEAQRRLARCEDRLAAALHETVNAREEVVALQDIYIFGAGELARTA